MKSVELVKQVMKNRNRWMDRWMDGWMDEWMNG